MLIFCIVVTSGCSLQEGITSSITPTPLPITPTRTNQNQIGTHLPTNTPGKPTTPIATPSPKTSNQWAPISPSNISGLATITVITHTEKIDDVYWSLDGTYLGVLTPQTLYVHEIPSFQSARSNKMPRRSQFFGPVTHKGDILAFRTGEGTLNLWDVQTSRVTRVFEWPRFYLLTIAIHPDGDRIARAGEGYYEDGASKVIEIIDSEQGNILSTIRAHENTICGLAFSPGGEWLASSACGRDAKYNVVSVWDAISGNLLYTLPGYYTNWVFVDFSHKGGLLAVIADNHNIRLWDTHHRKWVTELGNYSQSPRRLQFNPNDELVLGIFDGGVLTILDVKTGQRLYNYEDFHDEILGASFSPGGQYLATMHSNGRIQIWGIVK